MSEGKGSKVYDLRKMEDLFECVEIISMARVALYPVDERLASRLEKVSDALTAFSMTAEEEASQAPQNYPPPQGNPVPPNYNYPPQGYPPPQGNPPPQNYQNYPPPQGNPPGQNNAQNYPPPQGSPQNYPPPQGNPPPQNYPPPNNPAPQNNSPPAEEDEDAIIDIITGERIK